MSDYDPFLLDGGDSLLDGPISSQYNSSVMKIAIIGQVAFGEAVLKALLEQGQNVVGVSTPPDREGRADPMKAASLSRGIPWVPTRELKQEDVYRQFAHWSPDLGVMAFVTDILPEKVLEEPRLGTIQYHPSLLPLHRGASAINWAIVMGDTRTGLSIFWPDKGIDTGPILLQKEVEIGADDTVGSLYYNKLSPMGVEAMAEAVGLVEKGQAPRIPQDESQATYEPIFRGEHAVIDWTVEAKQVYDLVRGCDPQPGAATTFRGQQLRLFDSRLSPGATGGQPGEVLQASEQGIEVALRRGSLLVQRVRPAGGTKLSAAEFIQSSGIIVGDRLGS